MNNLTLAATRPLNLTVLVVALISGLSVSLWLLPVGLVMYATAVVLAARDPNLSARAQRPPPRAVALPKLTSPTFRTIVNEIDRSQREVERTLERAPAPLGKALQPMILQSRELVLEAHNLASKGQIIEQYLASSNPRQLQDQVSNLDIQIANTKDAYTIQQLQEVRTSLLKRQQHAADLQTYIGRINAQLANIDASLDTVLAEMVRILTADAVSASSMSGQVAERLSDMRADMSAFQRMLDSAMTGI
ncbi:hypothetical protein [Candidatus Oscillochloris fontis]|uniref:hypothetical protein n=1 Tax=Candidatus Oscillochloris fontis TaxID=2496868 RepID=UPI00101B66DC|nr:hypothetical protein [Candidatus Oscillochloris fontis]